MVLPDTIISRLNTNEKYVLDIIEHITKYLKSYGLRTKTAKEVLIYIKDFVYNVGSQKIFQFDNGTEFEAMKLSLLCIIWKLKSFILHPITHKQMVW